MLILFGILALIPLALFALPLVLVLFAIQLLLAFFLFYLELRIIDAFLKAIGKPDALRNLVRKIIQLLT